MRSGTDTATHLDRPVPQWLQILLSEHRQLYPPRFSGFLSDHFPMAALSMWHLRRPKARIVQWAADYRTRLNPSQDPAFHSACLVYDAQIAEHGINATVQTALPALLSGWVRDAFHPLIRLAYGMQFNLPGEVSAGLAYLEQVGGEPLLARFANTAQPATASQTIPEWPKATALPGRTFTDKAVAFLTAPAPVPLTFGEATLARYAAAVLPVMLQTGNFFALHLVTALDAFRIATAPLPEPQHRWLAAGLLTGYAAAGVTTELPVHGAQPMTAFATDTEHDFKIVVACQGLAAATGSGHYRLASHIFHLAALEQT